MENYPKEYIDYLLEFHGTRDYFECHEIMEEYWKANPGDEWLALIQLAVAIYHERQKNFKGSKRLYGKVLAYLQRDKSTLTSLSIDTESLENMVSMRLKRIADGERYIPFNLPLTDYSLVAHCKELCQKKGLTWQWTENMEDSLVFRHKLRDRSDVIAERKASLNQKKRERWS